MPSDAVLPPPVPSQGAAAWIDIRQAAYRNGFHKGLHQPVIHDGWYLLRSATTPFQVHVAAYGEVGPWVLSFSEPRIDTTILPGTEYTGPMPGQSGREVTSLAELGEALSRIYHFATVELPPSAYQEFLDATLAMPETTEAERVAIVRTAQGIFRQHLDRYWNQACAITGLQDRGLLRASHIKPWAASSDYEKVDVHNGLLLSALWDAAFDQGLISFSDEGGLLVSPKLSQRAIDVLTYGRTITVPMTDGHAPYLRDHRSRHGFGDDHD
ncbi:HNH endonuclease [Methylobacterium sp. WL7]|nr:HNH endonuclease [Methylobacterium sp. WL7]